MILFVMLVFQTVLALGCLVFMRDRKGGLTRWGVLAFWFFFLGSFATFWLIIF